MVNKIMGTGGKLVVAIGIASSALLAAWLLTGNRKVKTKAFVVRRAENLKEVLKSDLPAIEEKYI